MFGKPGLLAMLDMNLDMGAASMSSAILKGLLKTAAPG